MTQVTPAGWYPDPTNSSQERYWDGAQWTDAPPRPARVGAAQLPEGCLLHVKSHDEGKNADVYLYPDRVERVKHASKLSLSRAKRDAETIPMRSIGSVQAKKDGLRFTKVTVYATGTPIEFRLGHDDAHRMRDQISRLVLDREEALAAPIPSTVTAAPSAHSSSVADELQKLAGLRDAGVLSHEEFDAQKAKLLG